MDTPNDTHELITRSQHFNVCSGNANREAGRGGGETLSSLREEMTVEILAPGNSFKDRGGVHPACFGPFGPDNDDENVLEGLTHQLWVVQSAW